jgi:hypothetical protein
VLTPITLALSALTVDARPVSVDHTPPTVTVCNLSDKGVVHSGLLVGTAGDISGIATVDVSLDGGAFSPAVGTERWSIRFPTGLGTWVENSAHTIVVRAADRAGNTATRALHVHKGNNQDVNGDGFADVLVGGPTFDNNRGRVYLFYSSGTKGVPTDPTIDPTNQTKGQHVIGGEFVAAPETHDQLFGASVALGDVNGDGLADLIVGAPANGGGIGGIYVFYPVPIDDPNDPHRVILKGNAIDTPTKISGDSDHPAFGTSVAAGDVNGDGLADVVAGAVGSADQDGRVYVFHSQFINADPRQSGLMVPTVFGADTVIVPDASGTHLGQALGVGDVNGDGFGDVIAGANGGSQGQVYVFHSSPSGVPATTTAAADTHITGEDSSRFGTSLAVGDVNGDGFVDVLVGGPTIDSNRGRVYLFYSSGTKGVPTDPTIDPTDQTKGQHVIGGEFVDAPAHDQLFGASVALGDVNGDGLADLIVGAPANSSGTGRTYVFYPVPSDDPNRVTLVGNASGTPTKISGDSNHPAFGTSVATGDVTGDGAADVLAGATVNTATLGRAYVFHSTPNPQGVRTISVPTVFGANTVITGEAGGSFGSSVAQ